MIERVETMRVGAVTAFAAFRDQPAIGRPGRQEVGERRLRGLTHPLDASHQNTSFAGSDQACIVGLCHCH